MGLGEGCHKNLNDLFGKKKKKHVKKTPKTHDNNMGEKRLIFKYDENKMQHFGFRQIQLLP